MNAANMNQDQIKQASAQMKNMDPDTLRSQAAAMRNMDPNVIRRSNPQMANFSDEQIKQAADQMEMMAGNPDMMRMAAAVSSLLLWLVLSTQPESAVCVELTLLHLPAPPCTAHRSKWKT